MKLCLLICVAIAVASGAVDKVGQCPEPSGSHGDCVDLCLSDPECDSGLKCCSNGCGKECMVPVQIHAGSCPKPSKMFGPCVIPPNSCSSDASCASDEKCCPEGCGKVCKKAD